MIINEGMEKYKWIKKKNTREKILWAKKINKRIFLQSVILKKIVSSFR